MQLVLKDGDREFPVCHLDGLDLRMLDVSMGVLADVSEAVDTALRARTIRQRRPLLGVVDDSRPQFRAIDGGLVLKA